MTMEAKRAELLADIEAHTTEQLIELGIDPAKAEHAACCLADHLAEHWGGLVFTMPKDHAYRLSQREREILDLHSHGMRLPELAKRYGMTERGVRKLLARSARRHVVDNQMGLFGPANDAAA